MVDYYDSLLAAIPVVMLAGALASLHPAVARFQGIGAASVVASAILYEALFRHPPTEVNARNVAACSVVAVGWVTSLLTML
ncbi:MAG: hypothetical protein ABEJ74_08530 [Haloferacaceae archaeon]